MAQDPGGTKRALIEAAGELFAEHGLDGTSIRAIAEKGSANIAAINYHFGSKENLYTETLRFVVTQCACPCAQEALQDPEWSKTPEGRSRMIEALVKERFTSYLSPDQPRWYGRLFMRSLLDPTPSLERVVKQVMLPEHEALKAVLQRIRPSLTDAEARFWVFSLLGQVAFYVFSEAAIRMVLEEEVYDARFIQAAAKHVTQMMITALGLPVTGES